LKEEKLYKEYIKKGFALVGRNQPNSLFCETTKDLTIKNDRTTDDYLLKKFSKII